MTATQTEVTCPKCGGPMWDNRETKRNPKQPDFKCRDKSCEGVIWPPRNAAPRQASASTAKQPTNIGGPLPYETEKNGGLGNAPALYADCLRAAIVIAIDQKIDKLNGDVAGAITAIAATLFIEHNKRARA